MYVTFVACIVITFILSYPPTDYVVHGIEGDIRFGLAMGLVPFVLLTVLLGFFMSLGNAAVYKHIPAYYPDAVGPVGEIGRASCRARVCQYVYILVVAVALKKKTRSMLVSSQAQEHPLTVIHT